MNVWVVCGSYVLNCAGKKSKLCLTVSNLERIQSGNSNSAHNTMGVLVYHNGAKILWHSTQYRKH